jgi:hypothetical protein
LNYDPREILILVSDVFISAKLKPSMAENNKGYSSKKGVRNLIELIDEHFNKLIANDKSI